MTNENNKIFLQSKRLKFGHWEKSDLLDAKKLWGNAKVSHYICANGYFTDEEIRNRLDLEIENDKKYGMSYWPIYEKKTDQFAGCCGIRPVDGKSDACEIGCHLIPETWGKGYATEAVMEVIHFVFMTLNLKEIYVGHHPENKASAGLVKKLGFQYLGNEFYEPTGLYHPSYVLKAEQGKER